MSASSLSAHTCSRGSVGTPVTVMFARTAITDTTQWVTLGHVVASPRHAASCTSRLFRVEGTGRTPLSPARNRVSAAPLTPSPSSNTAARALGREVRRASRARAPHSPGATGRGGNRPRLARFCLSRGVAAPWRKPPPCLQATGAGRGEERRRQPGRAGAPGAARRPLPRPCARSPRRPWKWWRGPSTWWARGRGAGGGAVSASRASGGSGRGVTPALSAGGRAPFLPPAAPVPSRAGRREAVVGPRGAARYRSGDRLRAVPWGAGRRAAWPRAGDGEGAARRGAWRWRRPYLCQLQELRPRGPAPD